MERERPPLLPMDALSTLVQHTRASSDTTKEAEIVPEVPAAFDKCMASRDAGCMFQGKYAGLLSVLAYHIIGDCLDDIAILGMMAGLPTAKMNIQYKALEERYGENVQQSYLFDPETLEPYKSALKTQMLMKFQKDRSYIEQVLQEANNEIKECRSIQKFLMRLDQFKKSEQERNSLLEVTKENQLIVKKLSALLQKEKACLSKELDVKFQELGKIKDEYEDLIYENQIKARYIDNWENARTFQNNVQLQMKEDHYAGVISELENKVMLENKVNSEIELFLIESETEYAGEIKVWMDRYDKEMEMKELEVQFLKEKRDLQLERLQDLSEMYEKHKKEMEECLVLKEKRRLEELEHARLTKAAMKIQAWWRGTMYRNHLGPYRKKKGKKGKDKDKKK